MLVNNSYMGNSSTSLQAIIAAIAMLMLAVIAGLMASTANLIMVVLLVGLMVGIPLLLKPLITVWIVLAFCATSGVIIAILGASSIKLIWSISLLSMLLVLPVIMKLLGGAKGVPVFIWLAFIFMVYTLLAAVVQWTPMFEYIAGYKRYFQLYGLMFALALLDFNADDYRRWLKLMLFLALLQLPFCLFQYIVLVPIYRGSSLTSGSYDVVAGTFGGSLEAISNNSGDMVAFLIMAVTFVVARYQAGLISTSIAIILSIFLMFPLILGETKIVVILLPLTWFILMRKQFAKTPVRFVLQLLAMLLISLAFALVYISMNGDNIETAFNDILSYNIGSKGHGEHTRLNRTTVLSFWWEHQSWEDPLSVLFGNGLGSSYFTPSNPVPGHLGAKYFGWGIDLTSASILLWETGLLGFLLIVSMLTSAWFYAGRLWTYVADPAVRADALAIQACIALFTLYLFYNFSFVSSVGLELLVACVLGYLGYLVRVHLPQQKTIMGAVLPDHKIGFISKHLSVHEYRDC
jgi:hypothetical protein